MVLESPRAGGVVQDLRPKNRGRACRTRDAADARQAAAAGWFSGAGADWTVAGLRDLFRVGRRQRRSAAVEGDDNLVLWDFHDLLFHTHSTEGRQANPLGGAILYRHDPPPPAVRAPWPGEAIDLQASCVVHGQRLARAELLRARHSTRDFDETIRSRWPSWLSSSTARRASSEMERTVDLGDGKRPESPTRGPYPSGRRGYELELYLASSPARGWIAAFIITMPTATRWCRSRPARRHGRSARIREFAMDAPNAPQVLITSRRGSAGSLEVQFDRLFAHPEKCRRLDADALPDGGRHGARRLRDRQQQFDRFARMTGR